jgi:hypothetical protein
MNGEGSPSSSRFSIDEEYFPSLLPLLASKALLKMESTPFPKSHPNYKNCSIDGEHSPSIQSPTPQKAPVKMGSDLHPLSPLNHFMHLRIFAPYVLCATP